MSIENSLSREDYLQLCEKLKDRQNNNCFICSEPINETNEFDIDHH